MMQRIVVAGGGFAGLWAALAAARAVELAGASARVRIVLLSPDPWLVLRPRLYEAGPEGLRQDLRPVLDAAGVQFLEGQALDLDLADSSLSLRPGTATGERLPFDRLLIATGSRMKPPPIPGLAEHGFDIDSMEGAQRYDRHLAGLHRRPPSPERDGHAIIGAGFTGIELALELRDRLAVHGGAEAAARARIFLVERQDAVGPDLGPGPRPVILEALAAAGVEPLLGREVAAVDDRSVRLADGTRLPAASTVATVGMAAGMAWAGLGGSRDPQGRIPVDPVLRVPRAPAVFVAGDAARAAVDEDGNIALMSCQHALRMGRFAGHNAACDLLGLELRPYRQPDYVTCLDLGRAGAVFTRGWDRQVAMQGEQAKALKRRINTAVIYPPPAEREAILAMADPDYRAPR